MAEAEDNDTERDGSDGGAVPKNREALSRKLKGWIKQDIKHVSKWRKEAREDFAFYAGDQWSEEDLNKLRDQQRPAMVFNRVAPLVNAVVGSEINNRREVRYLPRETGDALPNELLTAAGEWFRDECNAEDEESDAFEDAVICGMGWTDTRLDFDDDPDGAPKIERMDPLEMGWDCYSSKPNLEDARRLWRVREMAYEDAAELTGEKDFARLHAGWIRSLGEQPEAHDQDEADLYTGTQDEFADDYQYDRKKVLVVEIRWIEKQPFWRGPDLMTGEMREYADEQAQLLRRQGIPMARQTRKVVRRAFIGEDILGEPDNPLVPPGTGLFGWECITGYRDKTAREFYGVVRAAKDPQRWSNKFFSQVMYLLNSQSKGGIIVERGAFEDDRQAEDSWAKADAITYAKQGALSGQHPKIQPKPAAQFPTGFFTLFQESKEAISDVTGLSKEFIGTREVDQAGVLEYQRRQSSLNLLASLFNALRRYRKRQGRVLLYLIQEHLADGRLVRIVSNDQKQYVPLTREAVANVKYDIIVDDSPSSPNEKERTWEILMQMLPLMRDMLTPDIMLELLDFSPIPASLVEKMRQRAAQQPPQPSPEEVEAQAKMQMEQQKHQLDMAGKQADLQVKQQENQMELMTKAIELFLKQREAEMQAQVDEQKLQNEMQKMAIREEANAIAQQRANTQRVEAAG